MLISFAGALQCMFSVHQVTFYDFDLLKLKSLDQYMHVLYEDARAFCAGKNYELHMCKLTTQQLGLTRSTDYPAGPTVS